jgi:putative transposase
VFTFLGAGASLPIAALEQPIGDPFSPPAKVRTDATMTPMLTSTQFVTDALVMTIWRRGKPDALLHPSDRGSQYTSEQHQRLMADHGVVCSMSRSFFSSLKTERTARKLYRTRDEAKADVFVTSSASTIRNAGIPVSDI